MLAFLGRFCHLSVAWICLSDGFEFLVVTWEDTETSLPFRNARFSCHFGYGIKILTHVTACCRCAVAQRMSWAAGRRTTRAEDEAYCLMGIFGINMPLLYGEGRKAFRRRRGGVVRVAGGRAGRAGGAERGAE